MPAYEQRCLQCGEEFEVDRKITDTASVLCPECGAVTERLISRSFFRLRGTGWANTGYAPPPPKEKKS